MWIQKRNECGVVFYHLDRDISRAAHGDDFSICGLEEDLIWIQNLMKCWFGIRVQGMLGSDEKMTRKL